MDEYIGHIIGAVILLVGYLVGTFYTLLIMYINRKQK